MTTETRMKPSKGYKQDLAKSLKTKKTKLVALEMNLSLHEKGIVRAMARLIDLVQLRNVLEQNINMLRKPGINCRFDALDKSRKQLEKCCREIEKINKQLDNEQAEWEKAKFNKEVSLEEIIYLEQELDKPADVLPFRKAVNVS